MKIIIVYVSFHHQNTEKFVLFLKEKLKAKIIDLKKTSLEKAVLEIKKYPLIGFGSGIYFGKHHQLLFKLIEQVPKLQKNAFIFSTSGLPSLKFLWHLPLKKKLKEKGFKIIDDFSLLGYDTIGFLNFLAA
jgi:flavodoxin